MKISKERLKQLYYPQLTDEQAEYFKWLFDDQTAYDLLRFLRNEHPDWFTKKEKEDV